MNKEIINGYCEKLKKIDIKHIEEAIENQRLIKEEKYKELNGCPQNFGLDDYIGLCEIEKVEGTTEQINQCERCWKKALNIDSG